MIKSFASDNNSGVHPDILYSIEHANNPHYVSYGEDPYTLHALRIFKDVFGEKSNTFIVITGTGANVIALQSITDRFEAVICADVSHLNVDECGATEHILGSKVLSIPTPNGKLQVDAIHNFLHYLGDQHHVQPRVISITQPTELGTLYTIDEISEIVTFAHKNNLKVHMDGSRLCNAAAALKCTLRNLTADLGIDILSFGGTKNGMMMGEAVVTWDAETAKKLPFIRKQNTQLFSKMRFISAQYVAYLSNDLHLKNAKQANDMARLLYDKLAYEVPHILTAPPECNAVFVKLPYNKAQVMQSRRFFYTWDNVHNLYRFMTSFDMTPDDINEFVNFIKEECVGGIDN